MTPQLTKENTLSILLLARWEQIAEKLAKLAGDYPAEEYERRPAENVRTFGDVLRHLAFWNQYVVDVLRNRKADDTANELPRAVYPSKARIIEALERTSREAAAALKDQPSPVDPKTLEVVTAFIEHSCEHYGQLVVYARLMGIVPPASRQS